MPITRDEFEQGVTDELLECRHALAAFLSNVENRDQAYSEKELHERVRREASLRPEVKSMLAKLVKLSPDGGRTQGTDRWPIMEPFDLETLKAALTLLVESDVVTKKVMARVPYYMYKGRKAYRARHRVTPR